MGSDTDDLRIIFGPTISFLFLLGKVAYHPKNDSFEYLETSEEEMKLSQLYSNDSRFPPIRFNGVDDRELSVIFAKVKKPKDAQKDSHNLGKTLLVDLIDFLLLKNVSDSATHFLAKHAIAFADWVFFLEIQSPAGTYITVRRAVKDPSKIAFRTHPKERNTAE